MRAKLAPYILISSLAALVLSVAFSYAAGTEGAPAGSASGEETVTAGALADTVLALRLSGDYTEAALFASRMRDLIAVDPEASQLEREDADRLVEALQFAGGLPLEARRELARADSLGLAMEQHWAQGLYAEAAEAAEQRLAVYERHYGPRHEMTATAADELGSLLHMQGEYERAEPLFLEALDIRRDELGERHVYVGASLNNLGMLYQSTGDLESARDRIVSALSILRENLGDRDLNVAAITANLGMLLQSMGDFEGAEERMLSALAIRRALLGDEAAPVAESLNGLGVLYFDESDFAAAEPFLRRSTAIWRTILGDDHPYVALSLTNMGALLSARGEYSEAEEFHRRAVDIYRTALGDDHPDLAHALNNLAHALESQGDYAAAEPLFREALGILRGSFGDRHPAVADGLYALAHVLQQAGRYEEAEPLYRDALAMHRDTLGERHPEVATDLSNLASLMEEEGRLEEATALYQEALEMREEALGPTSAPVAHSLSSIGHVKLRAGDVEAAEDMLERASETYDAARLRAGSGMARATMAVRLRPPAVALAVARLKLGREEEAWPAAEKALARALVDLLVASEERSLSPRELAREDSLRSAVGRLRAELAAYAEAAEAEGAGEAGSMAEETRDALLQAEAELSGFQREMAERYTVTEGHTYSLERVQAGLGPDAAIVGWIDAETGEGEVETWGYVIRDEGGVSWALCGGARRASGPRGLKRTYARYREQLTDPGSSQAGLSRDARGLWSARIEPLLAGLGGVEKLVVLPSGPLLGVPVETLIDAEGALLGERFAVSYAPSATVHAWLEERAEGRGPIGRMLLLGDPPFTEADLEAMESGGGEQPAAGPGDSAGGRAARGSTEGLQRLPGSRAEVLALADLASDPTVLLGPDAAERRLVELASTDALRGFGIVHMATHALVDDERPERSALVLSQVGLPDPLESALAGDRICDGLLEAGEIVREWELDCDLVTLSACETALGKEVSGEGYIGFAHAFLQAGARSLILSLWKVEDRATSLIMRRFYENRLGVYDGTRAGRTGEPMGKADALREAKSWLRAYEENGSRPYEHPYYWSAFVLIGDRS